MTAVDVPYGAAAPIQVLKFGSSVLRGEAQLADAVHEVYRHLREGRRVVAVVSALGDTTDRLLASAQSLSPRPCEEAVAALLATGEAETVALLHMALDRAGVPSYGLGAAAVGLRTRGARLDAEPVGADFDRLRRRLRERPVVIVPGFVGRHESGGPSLLGRGGSDLTALFLAHGLGARCLLVKDVPGLYAWDPAASGPRPERYASVRFEDALALDGTILQHKAVRFASRNGFRFRIGACADRRQTRVGAPRTTFAPARAAASPLRVGLLGLGTVGGGVASELLREPTRWKLLGAVVRTPRVRDGVEVVQTTDAWKLLGQRPEVLVHAAAPDATLEAVVEAALRAGIDVVSSDKELVARRGAELCASARVGGARFLHGAAVGGGVPMLETVRAARRRGSVRRLEGVLNGTANFVLDRQARGTAFDVALRIAQELGFAEADPRADLDGADAARKLAILAGAAFGREVDPTQVHCVPLHEAPCPQDAAADGCVVRMVARAELNADGTLTIEVSPRRLGADHPLAAARDEGNVLQVYTDAGLLQTSGRGAGRWPTVEAVLGDLHACARRPTRPRVDAGAADGAAVSDDSDEVAA